MREVRLRFTGDEPPASGVARRTARMTSFLFDVTAGRGRIGIDERSRGGIDERSRGGSVLDYDLFDSCGVEQG